MIPLAGENLQSQNGFDSFTSVFLPCPRVCHSLLHSGLFNGNLNFYVWNLMKSRSINS
ncbi:unnamed protein product [Gulo gulo]|uniref:Uncharacterized protein n=1 Tax=Gulo gulo TaxID=48420 RepID=A0A9X9PZQ2_GULGU|nr:unnamed protein product [Gulo gulo]